MAASITGLRIPSLKRCQRPSIRIDALEALSWNELNERLIVRVFCSRQTARFRCIAGDKYFALRHRDVLTWKTLEQICAVRSQPLTISPEAGHSRGKLQIFRLFGYEKLIVHGTKISSFRKRNNRVS